MTFAEMPAVFAALMSGRSVSLDPTQELGWSVVAEIEREGDADGEGPWLGLVTSGSTGRPKRIWKSWVDLLGRVQARPGQNGWVWGSSFGAASFAGVHVALHAWRNAGSVLGLGPDWEANRRLLREKSVSALSCTPTFLDLLMQYVHGGRGWEGWSPRQITLGGELVRAPLVERARRCFPQARFTVIYASAEFGVLARTHRFDGWYETDSLSRYAGQWRLREGELQLYRDKVWRNTGDLLEVLGELFRVVGRADHVANVGGTKVNLAEVAQCAEAVQGVRRAHAFSEQNSVVGQIIVLRYALEPNAAAVEVEARLQAHMREALRKEAWPRKWERAELGLGPNSKQAAD